MSDLGETVVAERIERTFQPRTQQQAAAKAKNFRFPVRRSQRVQSKAEMEANRALIADFIANKGVTVCPPGYAHGSVSTSIDFV
jgi:tRNA1(Val) A37 N6-methylase TrmN6